MLSRIHNDPHKIVSSISLLNTLEAIDTKELLFLKQCFENCLLQNVSECVKRLRQSIMDGCKDRQPKGHP